MPHLPQRRKNYEKNRFGRWAGPASTVAYYEGLMDISHREKGADFYPEIVIDSVNMTAHMEALSKKDYDGLGALLLKSLENLKAAGAQIAAVTALDGHL